MLARAVATSAAPRARATPTLDLDHVRPDLAEVLHRHAVGAGRGPARRRGPPPGHRAAHRPGERRGPVRPGHVRRVRPAGHRRPAPAPAARGPDRPHARPTGWSPASARSTASLFGDGPRPLRGDVLRLHRPRRHAGRPEPPQEGPPVRAGRAVAAAGGALHRGRRRSPRRHRRAPSGVAGLGLHGLPPAGAG